MKEVKERKGSYNNTNGDDGQRTNVNLNAQESDSPIIKLTISILFTLASLVQFVTSFALTPGNQSANGVCGNLPITDS